MTAPSPALRLAVVLSHPTQYYSPWFRHLAARGDFDLHVFYLWDFGVAERRDPKFQHTFRWDVDLLSGYTHTFVPNQADDPGTHHPRGLDNPGLPDAVAAFHPDAVLVFGYKYVSHLRLFRRARHAGWPLLFRGDSHLLGQPRPSLLKRLALRWVYRRFAAVTYVGHANRAYFETFGVPASRLFHAPHAVDHTRFDPASPDTRAAAHALRHSLGLAPGTRVILFAGKHVPAKQPALLLEAFLSLALPPSEAVLVFVGDGPEKPALLARASSSPVGSVHFLPFANQSEMPARYALADLFVLPSRGGYETWGLAVNEAMHLGVPCIVSDHVGCHPDLILPGRTGWVFPAGDETALAACLREALALPAAELASRGRAAREHVSIFNYTATTGGLRAALNALPKHRPTP
jgi:glycosyltransferase involved in cell wall biosynthesis